MKYLAHTRSGLCFAAQDASRMCPGVRAQEFIKGNLIEITGYQNGEHKAIARKWNGQNYDFKVFTQRQYKNLQTHLAAGWELRKAYDNAYTYDEMAVIEKLPKRKAVI